MENAIDLNKLRQNLRQGPQTAEAPPRVGPDGQLRDKNDRGMPVIRAPFA